MKTWECAAMAPAGGIARARPWSVSTSPAGTADRVEGAVPTVNRGRSWRSLVALLASLALLAVLGAIGIALSLLTHPVRIGGTLAGEFEQHDVLLFAWTTTMLPAQRRELVAMIAAVQATVRVVIIGDNEAAADARQYLAEQDVSADYVDFLCLPTETPWIRDFGPRQLKSFDGTYPVLDALTEPPDSVQEDTPREVAQALGLDAREIDLAIDGGNLISNGEGLCLTTSCAFQQSALLLGLRPTQVAAALRNDFGADQLAVLEPLAGESTGHVDMFAAFTDPCTVVVGSYDPGYDAASAKTLDDNARLLSNLETTRGRLKVVRIPMPHRRNDRWLSYTNVVFANGVLLVPAFSGDAAEADAVALSTYRELLPDWQIVPVAAQALMQNHGGPHCATAQLFRVAESPVRSH